MQEVLNAGQTWTSWSYAAAFPELSKFLKRTSPDHRCHCQVEIDDLFSLYGKRFSVSYSESKNKIDVFWETVKNRLAFSSTLSNTEPDEYVSARLFKIVDLSPLVLTALLGSTPQ
jgi:urate oxidase